MVEGESGKDKVLPPEDVSAFLMSVFGGKNARVRAVYEVLRALMRNREATQVAIKFGASVLPLKITDNEASTYGHIFDLWCAFVFTQLPRAEACEIVGRVANADIATNGQHAWNMLYKGTAEFDPANPDLAYPSFERVALLNEAVISGNSHGSSSFRPTTFVASLDGERAKLRLAEWPMPVPTTINQPLVHLTACDGRYWQIFHERLLDSIRQANVETLTHVHIINPDRGQEDLQAEVSARWPDVALRITTEQLDIPADWRTQWNGMNLRSFYTFLRFLRAGEVLATYGKPVVITEFDAQVGSRINTIVDLTRDIDVGLTFYADLSNHFPWGQVWAGTVLLNPTPGAMTYIRKVADYCAEVFLEGTQRQRPMWHIDQNALYVVFRHLTDTVPSIRLARFPDAAQPILKNFGNAETR